MHDPIYEIKQRRLGYLILRGEEVPVLVERLRSVPLGDWPGRDLGEEMQAHIAETEQRLAWSTRQAEDIGWLCDTVRSLGRPPDTPMDELVDLLSGADHTRALGILAANPHVGSRPTDKLQ